MFGRINFTSGTVGKCTDGQGLFRELPDGRTKNHQNPSVIDRQDFDRNDRIFDRINRICRIDRILI